MPITSNQRRNSYPRKQSGSSLIEVLVSILLMSFGLMGLAGMQAYAITAQKNATNRAIAASLANEMAEFVRLNPSGLAAGSYDKSVMPNATNPGFATCAYPTCTTAAALALDDLQYFLTLVREQLPRGGMELSRQAGTTNQADLWIVWEEPSVLNFNNSSNESASDNCPANAKALANLPRCFYMKVQI